MLVKNLKGGIKMKRISILVMSLLILSSVSLVLAIQGPSDGAGLEHDAMIAAGGQDGNPTVGEGIGAKIMAGNYVGEEGQQMQIQTMANNKIQLRVGGVGANCDCELTQEMVQNRTQLKMGLSNGQNSEIKIMPNAASETALARLRLKTCSEENGYQIELKEVAQGNQIKAAYEIKTQRQSKFLGLFQAKMQVQAQVDAETGEVIRTNKPWWAFLASEPAEE